VSGAMQVVLREQSLWNSRGSVMPTLVAMSAHGFYDGQSTGMRVYSRLGCADAVCRNEGWAVQHAAVVLTGDVQAAEQKLREDADTIRGYIRLQYGDHLAAMDMAINVQLAVLGDHHNLQMDTQVMSPPLLERQAEIFSESTYSRSCLRDRHQGMYGPSGDCVSCCRYIVDSMKDGKPRRKPARKALSLHHRVSGKCDLEQSSCHARQS
jgi:hypothetical protein